MNEQKPYPVRKHSRLKNYDYSMEGAYFITFCTKNRRPILSTIAVGRDALIPPEVQLTNCRKALQRFILRTPDVYPSISVDHYVIMPNHVHLLLVLDGTGGGGMRASRPTIQRVVKAAKGLTSRQMGCDLWQDGFYDHILRDKADYLRVWQYIDTNPAKWLEDRYFTEEEAFLCTPFKSPS